MKKRRPQTIAEFTKKHGQTGAAALLRVSTVTLWRWATGRTKPEGNDAKRLVQLGVTIS